MCPYRAARFAEARGNNYSGRDRISGIYSFLVIIGMACLCFAKNFVLLFFLLIASLGKAVTAATNPAEYMIDVPRLGTHTEG